MATSTVALDREEADQRPDADHDAEQISAIRDENASSQNLDADNPTQPAELDRQFVAKSPGTRVSGRNPWVLLSFLLVCGAGMYLVIASDDTKKESRDAEKPAVFEMAKPRAKVVPGKEDEPPKEPIADSPSFSAESSSPTREDLERQKELDEKRKRAEALRLARIKSAIIIAGGQGAFHTAGNQLDPNGLQPTATEFAFQAPRLDDTRKMVGTSNEIGEEGVVSASNLPATLQITGETPKFADRAGASTTDPNERFFIDKSDRSRNVAHASRLSHLGFTVFQGKIIDCVLETAIQSDLPGQLRCSTSNDVYAESGRTVMLPAKTRLIGQYNSAVRKGQVRVFVIWQRAIAPNGIDIQLDSPGTDTLGRAGIGGDVDNHYLEIFGVSAMLSIIGAGASSYGVNSGDQPNSASAYRQAIQQSFAQTSQQVLSPYAQVAPTIHVNQGEAIKIFVNRDLDFSHVYAKQPASMQPSATVIR